MRTNIQKFQKQIQILNSASVVGKLESQGPLKNYFDLTSPDSKFGMTTWEKAESEMVRQCTETAIQKSGIRFEDIDLAFAGDLTNQCASSTFGMKDKQIPYVGLYGACSTFALSLGISALCIESSMAKTALCASSSHFCSAERQYRFPLEYGCQRSPSSQTTVTGAGCAILREGQENLPKIAEFLPGIIRDFGITDASNMGAAMAPACADTLLRYFSYSEQKPEDFDLILTGDLGAEGHEILLDLCESKGLILGGNCNDCGLLIYDIKKQDVNSGGSGCGCSASVFCGYIMEKIRIGEIQNLLLIGTGALLNANTVLQKETIPGIAHLIRIER